MINSLVPVKLPGEFALFDSKKIIYTRSTQNNMSLDDKSTYKCTIKGAGGVPDLGMVEIEFFVVIERGEPQLPYTFYRIKKH